MKGGSGYSTDRRAKYDTFINVPFGSMIVAGETNILPKCIAFEEGITIANYPGGQLMALKHPELSYPMYCSKPEDE